MIFNEANKIYQEKRYLEAIILYKQSIDEEKEYKADSMYNIASCYIKLLEFKKSIEHLLKAIKECLNQNRDVPSKYYFNLAYSYLNLGENKKALIYFNTAWALDNEDDKCEKSINLILRKLHKENEKSVYNSNCESETAVLFSEETSEGEQCEKSRKCHKEIKTTEFIVIHRKNKGFEIIKYEIPLNNRQNITEKTQEFIECKRRNTKKFQRILENIYKKYKIEKMILL